MTIKHQMRSATARKICHLWNRNIIFCLLLIMVLIFIRAHNDHGHLDIRQYFNGTDSQGPLEKANYSEQYRNDDRSENLQLKLEPKAKSPFQGSNESSVNSIVVFNDISPRIDVHRNNSKHLNHANYSATKFGLPLDPFIISHIPLTIYDILPHLLIHPQSLIPALQITADYNKLSFNKKNWLTIGLPTAKRNRTSYLMITLKSLFGNIDGKQLPGRITVVVFIGEPSVTEFANAQVDELRAEFAAQIDDGLLEIVVPHETFYPLDLDSMPPTLGDSLLRMKWRTKQNLDFIYLMMHCWKKSTYYLQLEDDVITKRGYLQDISEFIAEQANKKWLSLHFSTLGFIGKLFRSIDLPQIIAFIAAFHRDKPVDWIVDEFFAVRYCYPGQAHKECVASCDKHRITHRPTLFQHMGFHSSLPGKIQSLKEKDFVEEPLFKGNPPALVSTSLGVYKNFTLDEAYNAKSFFWGVLPRFGDWIKFELTPPVHLETLFFHSGNDDHPEDIFYSTSVEVLFQSSSSKSDDAIKYLQTQNGYSLLTWFSSAGSAQASVINSSNPVRAVRLVMHTNSHYYVILRDIRLKAN